MQDSTHELLEIESELRRRSDRSPLESLAYLAEQFAGRAVLTPNVAHQMSEKLKKRWKNYYQPSNQTEESRLSLSTN